MRPLWHSPSRDELLAAGRWLWRRRPHHRSCPHGLTATPRPGGPGVQDLGESSTPPTPTILSQSRAPTARLLIARGAWRGGHCVAVLRRHLRHQHLNVHAAVLLAASRVSLGWA